jgi:hypothetical protein
MTETRLLYNRHGVSLPLVILMMALLALALTAGFSRVSEERRIVGDQQAQVDALAVAESGLERFVALLDTMPVEDDSVAIPIGPRDTAFVAILGIRKSAASRLYVIRSRGVSHSAPRFGASTPPAQRTVAQYASWQAVSMSVLSAWTAISGLRSEGGNGLLNGSDACGSAPDVAGIAVPVSVPLSGFNGFDAPPNPIGTPPIAYIGGDPTAAAGAIPIDWNSIVNGTVLRPDFTITGTPDWPPFDAAKWPVIRVDGNVTLAGGESGQGMIVVTGDLTLAAPFDWKGVILVGRRLTVSGTAPVVRGAIVSGLDFKLGAAFDESRSGQNASDRIDLRYDSCHIAAALARYGHLALIANAWTDSWPEN